MAYTRHLGQNGFRGVDFTSHPSMVSPDRFADALNVWKDYRSGQGSAIETFPGFRKIFGSKGLGKINGIFRFFANKTNFLLIHAGTMLWYCKEPTNPNTSHFLKLIDKDDSRFYVADHKSSGFQFGNNFYLIDGTGYYKIYTIVYNEGVELKIIPANEDKVGAYIPTTFINGVEHEQRNMLSTYENQEYGPLSISGAFGGYEFEFTEFSEKDMTCSVSGIKSNSGSYSTLVVPNTAIYNKKEYTVTKISKDAFEYRKEILSVLLPESIVRIGIGAFYGCTNLKTVYWSACDKHRFIASYAFQECSSLESVYVGYGCGDNRLDIMASAFIGVNRSVCKIYKYAPPETESEISWEYRPELEKIDEIEITDNPFQYVDNISIPIFSPCKDVKEVWLGTTELLGKTDYGITVTTPKDTEGNILSVNFSGAKLLTALGQTVRLVLQSNLNMFYSSKYASFLSDQSGYGGTAQEAVLGCTKVEHFDGRVFFTGNPNLPNTVFYTQRDNTGHNNPFYVGVYNYFNTGIGQTPNTAMIASGSYLYVLKGDTIQDGSINLYQGVDGTDNILPRFYVRQQGLAGVGCLGAACNFADDPVFISKRGLEAIGLQTVNLERTVQHRSTNVDRRLMQEDLSEAQLAEWEGYLVLLVPGGKVYLADSRQLFTGKAGYHEYEWYYLDGFCSYTGDEFVYAFSSALPLDENGEPMEIEVEGHKLCIYETPDAIVNDSTKVNDYVDGNGDHYKYIKHDDGKYYSVYPTSERSGGTENEATCIVSFGDELYFGTSNGDVCVINTDKRGVKPDYADITDEEYKDYSDVIAREWYTHMGHRYTSFVYLAQENAGVPHMAKNTVKKSVVLKAKDIFGSLFKWNVKTDRRPFGDIAEVDASMPDFSEFDFGLLVLDTTRDGSIIVINEKQKRYVEKQYAFFSDEYCRPFGIYHISYQYEIQGKVKNR